MSTPEPERYSPEWYEQQSARARAVIADDRRIAELGAKDGTAWAKNHPRADALSAAHACQQWHFRRISQKRVTAADVITYGQAFVDAAVAALEGTHGV